MGRGMSISQRSAAVMEELEECAVLAAEDMKSAVKKAAIDQGCRDDIKAELVDQVILKEQKTAKEQIDSCPESRQDLKAEYQFRYDVISEYAPKLMSPEAVEAFLKENCADILATGSKGEIMKTVMPMLKGKADGKVINQTVAKLTGK